MPIIEADAPDGGPGGAHCGDPVLTTTRLRLRALVRDDMPRIVELAGVPDVALKTASIPYPYSLDQGYDWFDRIAGEGHLPPFVIEGREGAVIGMIGLIPERGARPVEIGYWLGKSHWGLGYMAEAVDAMVPFGFAHFATRRIIGSVFPGNDASRRVLERCGFVRFGRGTYPAPARGVDREVDLYERFAPGTRANG